MIELDPRTHRTYHYWHVSVPGIRPGQIYTYRAHGRFDPERGLRFDPTKASSIPTVSPWSCPTDTLATRQVNTAKPIRSR